MPPLLFNILLHEYMITHVYNIIIIFHPNTGCSCPVDPLINDICPKYRYWWPKYLSYDAFRRYTCIDGYHMANASFYSWFGVHCLRNGTLREQKTQCVRGNVFVLVHPFLIAQTT